MTFGGSSYLLLDGVGCDRRTEPTNEEWTGVPADAAQVTFEHILNAGRQPTRCVYSGDTKFEVAAA